MLRFLTALMRIGESADSIIDEPSAFTLGRKALILFASFSYVIFFIEAYLGHYIWLQLFVQKLIFSFAIVPVFFSPIGLITAMAAAYKLTPGPVAALRVVMVASIVVGLIGTYFHVVPRIAAGESVLSVGLWLGDPPILAPAAFAFPGIIGLLAAYGLKWRQPLLAEGTKASGGVWAWLFSRDRTLHEGRVK